MATFTAINCRHQTSGAMHGTLDYVMQDKKTRWDDARLVTGHNCVPQSAHTEMLTTKQRFRKTDGHQFYHFVQLDTNHIHNHLVVNSVSCVNGKKLHQSADDLLAHRQANDEICFTYGLSILEEPEKKSKKKRMKPGEYQASLRDDSWKMDLIQTINDVLEYAGSEEDFISGMEYEGYQVTWTDTRQHITFACPNGRRCRDSSLHDETFLKENLKALFAYRELIGFLGDYFEPENGWIGEASCGLLRLGRELEQNADLPALPAPPVWTDSKLCRREAMKKLAHGQKLSYDSHNQGMSMY